MARSTFFVLTALLLTVSLPPEPDAPHEPSAPRRDPSERTIRARELGIVIGVLPTGPANTLTDVAGVGVGHCTVTSGEDVRTGVTVIVPCRDDPFASKLPAAVHAGNGFGKATGFTQVRELGELEAPIALTNTLSVGTVLERMVRRCLDQPGHEDVRSVNVLVGETNDGWLSDIRGQHVTAAHVDAAWDAAHGEDGTRPVQEGSVGAGTGTICFGFKGGIGSASRVVDPWTVGVLVQTNYGGWLVVAGRPFPRPSADAPREDGSCMVVIATDAPLDARNLERLARRAMLGLARTGSVLANGSGDYAIAFSTHPAARRPAGARGPQRVTVLPNAEMTPLFQAVVEATEEAVLNSLVTATSTRGRAGRVVEAIDHDALRRLVR